MQYPEIKKFMFSELYENKKEKENREKGESIKANYTMSKTECTWDTEERKGEII